MRKMMILMALALGTAAQAQDGARPNISPACRTEMQNLCPATGDRDARRACMMDKRDLISAPCKAEIKAAMEARRAAHGAGGGQMGGQMGGHMDGMSHGDMGGGNMSGGGMGGDQGGDGAPPPQ
ncbi:hypothetical protein BH09PSE3_BH09PSE3_17570 [soil metagenome]